MAELKKRVVGNQRIVYLYKIVLMETKVFIYSLLGYHFHVLN
jgi:hypothetical protein